jgi:hypothetical protein
VQARSTELARRSDTLARRTLARCTLALVVVATGIGCQEKTEETRRIEVRGYTPPAEPPAPPSLYDREGRLRESDRSVAGVRLPVGLRDVPAPAARTHAFETEASLESLRQYFAARVVPTSTEALGEGVLLSNAAPIAQQGSNGALDIMIAPVRAGTARVELRERAPPPEVLPSPDEVRRTLERLSQDTEE